MDADISATHKHVDQVRLSPEMEPYTIIIDGVSRRLACDPGIPPSAGGRPEDTSLECRSPRSRRRLAHASRAERDRAYLAWTTISEKSAANSQDGSSVDRRVASVAVSMRADGLPVDAIEPMGAMYLSARFVDGSARARGRCCVRRDGKSVGICSSARRWRWCRSRRSVGKRRLGGSACRSVRCRWGR